MKGVLSELWVHAGTGGRGFGSSPPPRKTQGRIPFPTQKDGATCPSHMANKCQNLTLSLQSTRIIGPVWYWAKLAQATCPTI